MKKRDILNTKLKSVYHELRTDEPPEEVGQELIEELDELADCWIEECKYQSNADDK